MSREMDNYLHDENGRRLTPRERLDRLRKPFADQTIKTEVPGGTLAERQQQRKAQAEMGREIAADVQRAADELKPAVNPFAVRVAAVEQEMGYAPPHLRQSLGGRLTALRKAAAQWEADKAAAERKAAFDTNPSIQLMRENAEALERSAHVAYPDVKRESIDFALAVAKSSSFDKPDDQASKYWHAIYALDDQQRAAEAVRMQAATDKAAQASLEFQQQKAKLAEAEQRAANAAKMGAADAS